MTQRSRVASGLVAGDLLSFRVRGMIDGGSRATFSHSAARTGLAGWGLFRLRETSRRFPRGLEDKRCLQSCRLGRAAHLQTVALGCALITPGVLLDQMGAGLRDLALE